MKFHPRWFGLTGAAIVLATLVACPTATTTQPTAQTITFTALTDKSVGDPAVTLTATASSGLAVSFSSLTAATCTVATGKVSPIAVGKCTIAADQTGNATFAAAPRVEGSFNIKACVPVVLNNNALTTWTLKRVITGGSAAYSPLEVVLTGLTGSNVDSTDSIKVDSTGTITACTNNVTFTLTLSQGGSARGVLTLNGTIDSTVANQPISGNFTSTGILNTTTGLSEVGTFTMTHN